MTTKLALTQSTGFRGLSRDRADDGRQNHCRQRKLHRLVTYVHDGGRYDILSRLSTIMDTKIQQSPLDYNTRNGRGVGKTRLCDMQRVDRKRPSRDRKRNRRLLCTVCKLLIGYRLI